MFQSKSHFVPGFPTVLTRFYCVRPETQGSSEFSDSDLDVSRRRSRRSQKKQVNYCETSESEGSQAGTNRSKMKPRRQQESSESEGQSHKVLVLDRDDVHENGETRPFVLET